jgi:hypothetical protein
MATTESNGCGECGYQNCAHEGGQLPPSTVDSVLPESKMTYNIECDNSLDHKSRVLQGQGIHFALMRYFGSDSTVNDKNQMLCYNWLEKRGPLRPLYNVGDYLAYRLKYNFEDIQ